MQAIEVFGRDGDDYIRNETNISMEAHGEDGDDHIVGGSAGDVLIGGRGDDFLEGRQGNDHLEGGADNDQYRFFNPGGEFLHHDTLVEQVGGGSDQLNFGRFAGSVAVDLSTAARQVVNGQMLQITLVGNENFENVWGSDFNDLITGNAKDNGLFGRDGDDTIFGLGGNDVLHGNWGNDQLFGGTGLDTL